MRWNENNNRRIYESGRFIMNVTEVKKNIKDKKIKEIIKKIDKKEVEEEEWFTILQEMQKFLATDPPEDVKRLFVPLGYMEQATMICDGIIRWRRSLCYQCKRREKEEHSYSCEIYRKRTLFDRGIPSEIWAMQHAECPYYERMEL